MVPIEELADHLSADEIIAGMQTLLTQYRRTLSADRRHLIAQFRLTGVARKVVGVGSVGTRAWILLLEADGGQEPLFLQAKEAQRSVLADYCGASKYRNEGQRVVAGQHLMQAASDIFLGWQHVEGGLDGGSRDFYVRQLRDMKYSAAIEQMLLPGLVAYAELCGWTLARAHARSGDRFAIAGYLGQVRQVRPGAGDLRRALRRPHRPRPRRARGRGRATVGSRPSPASEPHPHPAKSGALRRVRAVPGPEPAKCS